MAQAKKILLIGNPGVGKSTLLNGLVGTAAFKSGISRDGSGVSTTLQAYSNNGITYVDTPGLSDDVRRKQCADEIEKSLKLNGSYYLCFVLTMEAGCLSSA